MMFAGLISAMFLAHKSHSPASRLSPARTIHINFSINTSLCIRTLDQQSVLNERSLFLQRCVSGRQDRSPLVRFLVNFLTINRKFPKKTFMLFWLIWFDLIWFDLIWFDLIWFGLVYYLVTTADFHFCVRLSHILIKYSVTVLLTLSEIFVQDANNVLQHFAK